MVKKHFLLFFSPVLFVGCQSAHVAVGPATPSTSYEVTATYQLEIKDEGGRIIHQRTANTLAQVKHDAATLFSAEELVTDYLNTAQTGLDASVSNVVQQLRDLPAAPVIAEAPPETPSTNTVVGTHSAPDERQSIVADKRSNKKADPEIDEQPPPSPLQASQNQELTGSFRVKKVSDSGITLSKHADAVVGSRFFVRGTPEVIIDPFTKEERLISKGQVNGVVEVESVGLFAVKAKLLSGTAEKGNYLEAIEPTPEPVTPPANGQ